MELAVHKADDGVLTLDDFRCGATERRREARTAVLKRVWVFLPKREPQIGHLVDCSPHGVGMLVRTCLREGDEFGLKLRIPRLELVTYCVRHCRAEHGQFRIGALLAGIGGIAGHPDLELVFRALMEMAARRPIH